MDSPADSEVVIIGGGAIGCGVAYSLASAGQRDILLLERAPAVAQATTSQGAGLCGQVRDSVERVRLAMHSVATFRELQRDPDVRPGWNEVGSLRIALSEEHASRFRALEEVCRRAGLEAGLIPVGEARRRWPPLDLSAARAILWCPSDGTMVPHDVAAAYQQRCRQRGVRFATETWVEGIVVRGGRVQAVETNRGRVACRLAVNAAGAHAYHVARLAGLELPIIPVRHQYFVTGALPGLEPGLPCLRVPEMGLYARTMDRGLLLGGWEPEPRSLDPREYGLNEPPPPVATDWNPLLGFEARFAALFPAGSGAEKTRVGKGWPTFTPDGRFIIGESLRVRGFVMAAGCNAHGISGSAGIGRLLAESILDPNPTGYVSSLSPDRFTETSWDWESARRRAEQVYGTYYGC